MGFNGTYQVRCAGVDVAAPYPVNGDGKTVCHYPTTTLTSQPFKHACFSSAPLSGVTAVDVFSDEASHICLGILLQYGDGTLRALGQCRFGAASVVHTENPVQLCLSPISYEEMPRRRLGRRKWLKGQLTHFLAEGARIQANEGESPEEEQRVCYDMRGTAEFWYYCRESRLQIAD